MSLSTTTYTYDGKVKKPKVTAKDKKGKKIAAKYYTVKYLSLIHIFTPNAPQKNTARG